MGGGWRALVSLGTQRMGRVGMMRPVGALTSKPYAFTSRSWELKSTESIDVFDGIGSNIRVDTRGSEIMRILPRLNEEVNEEFISDKVRFAYDGLKRQRLTAPMVRTADGMLTPVGWDKARTVMKNTLLKLGRTYDDHGYEAHAIIGPYVDVEALVEFRSQFLRYFPGGEIHLQEQAPAIPTDFRHNYVLNTTLPGLEDSDLCLLIGANPRKEAPLLNTRLRKGVLHRGMQVASVGCAVNLTYPHQHLGHSAVTLQQIANGRHSFCKQLATAQRPTILVSNRTLQRDDGAAIYDMAQTIAKFGGVVKDGWDGFNVLHSGANTVGALDIGFDDKYRGLRTVDSDSKPWSKTKLLFLLGSDEVENLEIPDDCFVIYQGSHGDAGAAMADLILPGAAFAEKESTFVNTEGRVQRTKVAFYPPGSAMEDRKILHDLLGAEIGISALMKSGADLDTLAPHLKEANTLEAGDRILEMKNREPIADAAKEFSHVPFGPPINNFYMTDPITRSSKVMAKCTRVQKSSNFDY